MTFEAATIATMNGFSTIFISGGVITATISVLVR